MCRFISARALALLGASSLGFSMSYAAAGADKAGEEGAREVEQVIVTARKRPESAWDVPFSVDVQTRSQLEEKRATDGMSALRGVGGAGVTTFGDRSSSFIVMRGVAPVLTPLSPDDSSVLTFVDGAPLSISASNSAYLDLERIEVLKGPQSALFGRNTAGGAVNLIPAEPTLTPEKQLRAEYASDDVYRVEGILNGRLGTDALAGRLALRRSRAGAYVDNAFGSELGGEDSWVGRASLLFAPSDQTRWLLSASAEGTDVRPIFYLLSPGPRLAAENLARDDAAARSFSSKLEHTFGGAALVVRNYPIRSVPGCANGLGRRERVLVVQSAEYRR